MKNLRCIHSYNGLRVANGGYVMPCCFYDESKPFKDMKKELIRIEFFQKHLDNLNIKRWTKKDFYNYWKFDNL